MNAMEQDSLAQEAAKEGGRHRRGVPEVAQPRDCPRDHLSSSQDRLLEGRGVEGVGVLWESTDPGAWVPCSGEPFAYFGLRHAWAEA